jgi:hypothetical protein
MTDVVLPAEWNLHYEAWVISDGEPDRSVGEVFDWFAVEFWSDEGLAIASEMSKSVIVLPNFEYRVCAEVIYLSEAACVIDFGLNAIAHVRNLASRCKEGGYVSGRIGIGLPASTELLPEHFFNLYQWRVNRISADLTPYLPDIGILDRSRAQYREIDSTKSGKARGYVLHCSEINSLV